MSRDIRRSTTSFSFSFCLHLALLLICGSVIFVGQPAWVAVQLDGEFIDQGDLEHTTFRIVLPEQVSDFDQLAESLESELDVSFEQPKLELSEIWDHSDGSLFGDVEPLVAELPPPRGEGSAASPAASFFGIPPVGDRIVYLIDRSPSMSVGRYQSRYNRAINEVLHSIEGLREDQEFFVIMFSFNTLRVKIGSNPDFAFATEQNKRLLEKKLRSIELSSGTDPREALVAALKLTPSCIFLLSDGEFNGHLYMNGKYKNRIDTYQLSLEHNRQGCPIHTIGLEEPATQAELSRIADASGGTYVFVPAED